VALAAFTIAAAALPPFVAWVGKLIIDAVVAAHAGVPGAARAAALDRAVRLGRAGAGRGRGDGRLRTRARAWCASWSGCAWGSISTSASCEKAEKLSLRHFEDAAFYDKLTRARREASTRPLSLIQSNFQVDPHGLTLAGYVALLIGFSGWMALAVLVGDGAGVHRGGALLGRGVPPAQLALARFAAADLPRIRARQRRARQGGEAVRPRAAAARRYKRLAETFFADDRSWRCGGWSWGYALSLVARRFSTDATR
jgi:ATP-binding cassette subfamily B protein